MKTYTSLLFLGFFFTTSVFAAFPASIDTDGDGVPNEMEFWLRAHGIAVSESTPDTYTDTDGDGIPDLVEDNISHTDKTVNESTVATAISVSGFNHVNNTGEIAGQWDACLHATATDVSGDIGTPDECESVYTAIHYFGFSVLHSTSDQIKTYAPGVGYATPAGSYNSGTNVFSATFSEILEDGTVVISVINATFDSVNSMTGTLNVTEDGVPEPQQLFTAVRRASGWTGTGDPSGIYAIQGTEIDTNTGLPFQRSTKFTPENDAVELNFSGAEVIGYDQGGTTELFGLFYIPALGTMIEGFAFADPQDLDGDGAIDDTFYEVGITAITALALPAGNNTGLIRGVGGESNYNDINSNQPLTNGIPTGFLDGTIVPGVGDSTGEDEDHFYGRHHEPFVSAFTRNTTAGFQSVIALNNVPLAASRITVSGPGGFTTTDLVNESGGTTMADAVRIRNRANPESRDDGFVGLQVGISGADTHAVSNIGHLSDKTSAIASLFPNGPYTYSTGVAGSFNDPRGTASVSASYTRPANVAALMDVANPEPMTRQIGGSGIFALNPGVPLNRFVLGNAKANAGNGVDFNVTQSLTLTWQAVTGASSYVVRITCVEGALNDCDKIEQFVRFVTGATNVTIPANTLDGFTAYRLTIDARNADNSLISTTTGTGINNTKPDTLIQGNTLSEGPNVVGWTNSGAGSNFESIHRPGNTSGGGAGSGIGFILLHGRCNHAETNVVSTLRRSIASDGYDTISIRLPADTAVEANNCNASSSPYSQFVAGAAYVVPEAVARVRQAMNELVTRNGSINRVVLVGFSLGTRLSAAAAAPSNHNTDTPVPIVGLVLTGTRSGGGAVSLDTTTALAEISAPILDYYMDEDFPAVSTAAARVAAYAGNPADYTQSVLPVNDPWGLVDGSTSNIGNPRHKFLGYENVLRDTVSQWIASTSFASVSNPAKDYNGDGRSDAMVRHTDGRWFYFPMNGRNVLIAQQGIAGITTNNSWQYQGSGDFNGDGNADVMVRHTDGRWFYFPMNGRGVITAQQGIAGITTNNSWQYQGSGDMNGDGKDDVLVRHTDGRWFYFPMNGRGVIVAQQGIAHLTTNTSWQYAGMGDMNGDGKDDVLVRHTDGRWFYFPMNGRNVLIAQQGVAGITTNTSWQFDGMGDMNGDGKSDVLVRHTDGRWFYFPMNGRSVIAAQQGIAFITTNTSWQFAGMRDMNGDGKDDVLVRHTDGRWFYFPMNGRNVIIAQQGVAFLTTNTAWGVLQ